MTSADDIIRLLDLAPHPEGGFYRQTFRDTLEHEGRPASTAIYFLLKGEAPSHWHRIDAIEIWLHHAGAPLRLSLSEDGTDSQAQTLGPDIAGGERPQGIVPRGWWQAAASLGDWSLVSCTVAPGFRFEGFELAPPDWHPREPA
jgi:predicted cupin superfamily sugar epimerase